MQVSARQLRGVAATLIFLLAVSAQAYFPEWPQKSKPGLPDTATVRTGDLNGDGRPDVLVRTNYGVYAMFTSSDGTVGPDATELYTGTTFADILLADFNNDGKIDAVIADTGTNRLVALSGNGDGTFAAPVITTLTIAPTELALGDFDGDGHPDVLVRSATGPSFAIFKSDGALQFSLLSSVALTSSPYRTAVGDLDGDGKTDVVIGLSDPVGLQVHFGKGNGTFDAPVAVAGAPTVSSDIALGDLNGDGRVDIVTSQTGENQVTVILNSGGGRAFAAAVSYEVRPSPKWYGYPRRIAVLDATDDGKLDVVAILIAEGVVATLPGNGDGTLGSPRFTYNDKLQGGLGMAAADFTSDGRLDLVVAASSVVMLRNAPGEVTLSLNAASPTLSAGQTERFTARASLPLNITPFPAMVGTVTVNEGATALGSGDLSAGSVTIDSSSLSLGTHTLSASYPGNSDYHAAVSNSVSVNVISETTTTTLTSDHPGQVSYGTEFMLTGSVTSPVAGSLYGSFWLYTDGQRSQYSASGPPITYYDHLLLPGVHTFYLTYDGNATQPPSTSNTVTQEIVKADPGIRLVFSPAVVRYGDQPDALVQTHEASSTLPTGAVHIYEGRTLVMTTYLSPSGGQFKMAVLPVGVHYLYAVYDGDSLFSSAQSPVAQYSVLPNTTLTVTASADPVAQSVSVAGLFSSPNNGFYYVDVYRRTDSTPWILVAQRNSPSYTQSASTGVTYSFYMEAYDYTTHLLATSNVDSTMLASFTDDPLTAGTSIKAQHLAEIVTAVNVFRGAANLQPIVLPDIAPGGRILATHLTALQNGLNEARTALGSATFAFTGGTPGAPIKAQQVQDLREAIR